MRGKPERDISNGEQRMPRIPNCFISSLQFRISSCGARPSSARSLCHPGSPSFRHECVNVADQFPASIRRARASRSPVDSCCSRALCSNMLIYRTLRFVSLARRYCVMSRSFLAFTNTSPNGQRGFSSIEGAYKNDLIRKKLNN